MRLHSESGAGLVSTLAGLVVFLFFLLFATQILLHLLSSSFVHAAAFDAARIASGTGEISPAAARSHGLSVLGSLGGQVSRFDVTVGESTVTVVVEATSPALVPATVGRALGMASIRRSVSVRRELVSCDGC